MKWRLSISRTCLETTCFTNLRVSRPMAAQFGSTPVHRELTILRAEIPALRLLCPVVLMSQRIDTEVLIVGVDRSASLWRWILPNAGDIVTLVEMRAAGEPPKVSCNHVSARTMETFRRLGIVFAVRNAGLPVDYPNDVAFRTTATGIEMARIPIPCRTNRYTAKGGPDTWWPTPEPPHRINQIYLEPVLFACATKMQRSRILHHARVSDFEQDEHGVLATRQRPELQQQLSDLRALPCRLRRRPFQHTAQDRGQA